MSSGGSSSARRFAISQIAARGPALDLLEDRSVAPRASRIRPFDGSRKQSDDLVAMAVMIRAPGGAPLRLGRAVLDHEHGTYASPKSEFPLVWEGEAQQEAIIEADTDFDVEKIETESVSFEFIMDGKPVSYTVDLAIRSAAGRERLIEIKRDDRDLEDPEYRLKLAHVAEICRRCDIDFQVLLRADIFRSDRHRRNAAFVASRGFTTIEAHHLRRFEAHRREVGSTTSLGDLAEALEPGSPVLGEAIVHALVVRRRVRMDLTGRMLPSAPVSLH